MVKAQLKIQIPTVEREGKWNLQRNNRGAEIVADYPSP